MEVIKPITEEPGYFTKRGGLYMMGKIATHQIADPIAKNIVAPLLANAEAILPLGSIAGAVGGPVGLVTIGLVAGLSAGLTQMDYNHKITQLKDSVYAEELSAKLKKPIHKLTDADLYNVAKENRTIDEQIRKTKRQRNFGVFFSFTASLASMALVTAVMIGLTAGVPALAHLAPHHLPLFSVDWFTKAAIQGVMGLTAYHLIKAPLHWLGDKLFGLDKETTHDGIVSLKRNREAGKIISPEQVLSVFVDANPQLDQFIAATYGERFDKLNLAGKQVATEDLSKLIPLAQLTADINSGKINVTELAFAVEGEISGVEHKEGAPRSEKKGLWARIRSALHFKPHPKTEVGAVMSQAPEADVAVIYAETTSGRSFVQRLARGKMDTSLGYVKQLEQRAQNAPSSQTIQ